MERKGIPKISYFEVTRLACLNWQKDGCPPGRDLDYFLEAESLLKATRRLLRHDGQWRANGKPKRTKIKIRLAGGKLNLRPEAA